VKKDRKLAASKEQRHVHQVPNTSKHVLHLVANFNWNAGKRDPPCTANPSTAEHVKLAAYLLKPLQPAVARAWWNDAV
jgi:hypothetical protein